MLPLFQSFQPHPQVCCSKEQYDADLLEFKRSHNIPDDAPHVENHPQFKWRSYYRYNYPEIFAHIAKNPKEAQGILRSICKTDRFFLAYFVANWESDKVSGNKPYIVSLCRELEEGPQDGTIDVHAREHGKSACITIAGTLQRILNNPECTTAIFSFRKSSAEKFLESIKHMLESDFMKWLFPDICYENTNQTQWSVQNGIRVKRVNQAMKEHTVEAFGLIEGMPTGGHYDHRIYDDIETEDMASSPDQMQLCFDKLMMSRYLGRDGGTEQVIGTYYSHFGTIVKLKEVKDIHGKPLYLLRLKPGTDDGTVTGKPVFFSQKYLDSKKVDMRTFNTQILCNPTPQSEIKLDFTRFRMIERKNLPKDRIKFVIIDPAGDKEVQSGSGNDSWAMLCCSVRPYIDELGNSDVYIEDGIVSELGLSAAIDAACNLYIRNGRIGILGIEKVANDTTYRHIQNALTARGRYLELRKSGRYGGNLMLLSPSGRSKNYRIETALAWPLNNSKLHYTDDLDIDIVARLKEECNKFPYFHVDMLDALAYVYDILADPTCAYNFGMEEDEDDWEEEDMVTGRSDVTGY
jgi:hypothetical protein